MQPISVANKTKASEAMTAEQLLSELKGRDIRLVSDGERLRCSAPKGALTREIQNRIAAAKPELIALLRDSTIAPEAIRRLRAGKPLPLSFAQERFWFLHKLDPASTAYNITAWYRFRGTLDSELLRSCLRRLLERHEILRTSFPVMDGFPVQKVHPTDEFPEPELLLLDVQSTGPAEKHDAVNLLLGKLSRKPFDLTCGPLLRLSVIKDLNGDSLVVLVAHHIICDAWSIEILFSELRRF
jgi:hypothetical protein